MKGVQYMSIITMDHKSYYKYINEGKEYPAIVLAPQCPEGRVWNNLVFALKELL